MPAKSITSHEVRPINSANARILALSVEWIKTNPAKFATVLKAYGVPIAGAALAVPIVAMLPFGPLGPAVVALARSFAGFHARQTIISGFHTALGAGGVSGVQGRIVSLLSFMSVSATFESLEVPLQSRINDLIRSLGSVNPMLASLSFATVTELTGRFGVFPRIICLGCTSALPATMKDLIASKATAWCRWIVRLLWRYLTTKIKCAIKVVLQAAEDSPITQKHAIHNSNTARTRWRKSLASLKRSLRRGVTKQTNTKVSEERLNEWELV